MSENSIRILDNAGVFVGIVPATVSWRRRLQGSAVIDSAVIAPEQMKLDGTTESRLWMLDRGWQFLFEGGRYVVDDIDGDFESGLTLMATSAELSELSNFDTNYSPGSATYLNMLPSRMMNAMLSGKVGRAVKNPGFGILDNAGKPQNWTHPAGWTAPLIENRRVWQCPAGGAISRSDDVPCAQRIPYQVGITGCATSGGTGTGVLSLEFQGSDGAWSPAGSVSIPLDGTVHTVTSEAFVATGRRARIGVASSGGTVPFWVDDVRLFEIGPNSGWTYIGEMDERPALIPYNAGTIQRFGVWAIGSDCIYGSYPGDVIAQIVNGPFVTIGFAAGGIGAQAKVRINGNFYTAAGADLVPGEAAFDVSAAVSLTAPGLDPSNAHIVEVWVAAGTVKVTGFTVTSDNLVSMNWDYVTHFEALGSMVKAVGGELSFDAVAKTITHQRQLGRDLRAENVTVFRRGTNVVSLNRKQDRRPIVNSLTLLGYGEGQYQLVVTADATGVNEDGETSRDVYGLRRGKTVSKDLKDLATAQAQVARMVEQVCWPTQTYAITVTDADAALCNPGDTVHFWYRDLDLDRRVLEIQRSNDSNQATLVVGDPAASLEAVILEGRQNVATMQKSYQGVPTDSNTSFSEAFERTPSGSDYPANVAFFVPYGADMLDLRLRYQVGGMRAYARSAMDGGAELVTSEGGGSGIHSSESSSEMTTTAMVIHVHYELDISNTIAFTVDAVGVHDVPDTAHELSYSAPWDRDSCNTFLGLYRIDFNGHIAGTGYHLAADTDNTMAAVDNTSLATLCASANAAKGNLNGHTPSLVFHYADVNDLVTAADATDEPSLVTLCLELAAKYTNHIARANVGMFDACNQIKDKVIAHMHSAVYHSGADSQTISSPDADSVASAVTLMSEAMEKFNIHLGLLSIHRMADASNIVVATITDADSLLVALGLMKTCANHHFLGISAGSNAGVRVATSRHVQVADTARSIECPSLVGGDGITFVGCIQNNGSAEAEFGWTLYGTYPGESESVLGTGTETIAAGSFANVESPVDVGYSVRFEVTQVGTAWDTDALIDAQPGTPATTGPAEGGGGGGLEASTTLAVTVTADGEFETDEWTHGFDTDAEIVQFAWSSWDYDEAAIRLKDIRVVRTSATTCKLVGTADVI